MGEGEVLAEAEAEEEVVVVEVLTQCSLAAIANVDQLTPSSLSRTNTPTLPSSLG